MPYRNHLRQHTLAIILSAGWLMAVGVGVRALLVYANTPGPAAVPAQHWPEGAPTPSRQKPTLLVFLHPQCPCSRATIGELAEIMARCPEQVVTTVYLSFPAAPAARRDTNSLWRSAAAIPEVRVLEDDGGRMARLFGARTSGQVLLYDSTGTLAFKGGITVSRGHAGDNFGREAIVSLIRGNVPRGRTSSVFGCALFGEE
jgi:hypothetical protein